MSMSVVLFGSFAILLLLNVPIALALGFSSLLAFISNGTMLQLLPLQMHAAIGKFTLLAIPF